MATIILTVACKPKQNTPEQPDQQAIEDSIKEAKLAQELADPSSQASLEKEIREWTATHDHMLYYSDELHQLLDSVDRISTEVNNEPFFKVDIWYASNSYDENGKDSLVKVTQYNDSIAEVMIRCTQFDESLNKFVTLHFNPLRKHWYIEDFHIGSRTSIAKQCHDGIKKMIQKAESLKAKQEAELREAYYSDQSEE